MERLTERFSNGQAAVYGCGNNCKYDYKYCNNHLEDCPTINEIYEKLAAYEDAEEQGLLLRLPCKVGDTVYTACSWGIESGVVGNIEIIADRVFVNNIHGAMIAEAHNVFLNKEEAEQALARLREEKWLNQ